LDTCELIHTLVSHTHGVVCLVHALTHNHLMSCSLDTHVKIWCLSTYECLRTLQGHAYYVESLIYAHKRDEIITGSWDHTIRIWSRIIKDESITSKSRVLRGHTSWVMCLLLIPPHPDDGHEKEEHLLSGSADQTLRVWNVKTNECERVLVGHTSWITCLTLVDKQQMLIASGSSDSCIKLWDLKQGKGIVGKCLRTFDCQTNWITCLVLAVNTSELVSGFRDGRIKVWNLRGRSQEIKKHLGEAAKS
jgi:WD40 repeat protein